MNCHHVCVGRAMYKYVYVCTWPIIIAPVENFLEYVSIIIDYDETVVASFHHQVGLIGNLFKEVVPLQSH